MKSKPFQDPNMKVNQRTGRVIVVVLDSLGVGAMPDAAAYGDEGAHTLLHVAEAVGGLSLPHLERLGLGRLCAAPGIEPAESPLASFGTMAETARGKDTVSGHWELMGVVLDQPFALYPRGFPADLIDAFLKQTGFPRVLGNRAASGTAIIEELGDEHLRSACPIVYTSADSVFQIAAHEEVVPLEKLYAVCETARALCDPLRIGRVIARPFTGKSGTFTRTPDRKDFAMKPPAPTALDRLSAAGVTVTGIGKIHNIFSGQGITRSIATRSNEEGVMAITDQLRAQEEGLIFANLIDFDMLYGHRNDAAGYARALEAFDAGLDSILDRLNESDLLILTADHGCDPTFPGTDHTREYVPLLVYGKSMPSRDLGVRASFADLGVSLLDWFRVEAPIRGKSFLEER